MRRDCVVGERGGRVSFSDVVAVGVVVAVAEFGARVSSNVGVAVGGLGRTVSDPSMGAKAGSGLPAALALSIAFSWASIRW